VSVKHSKNRKITVACNAVEFCEHEYSIHSHTTARKCSYSAVHEIKK